jgi:hypothetical protein
LVVSRVSGVEAVWWVSPALPRVVLTGDLAMGGGPDE